MLGVIFLRMNAIYTHNNLSSWPVYTMLFSFVNAWQKHKFIYMFTQCLSSVDGPMQTNQSEVITRLVEGTILYQWETKPTIS
jgi:hypothetical protein